LVIAAVAEQRAFGPLSQRVAPLLVPARVTELEWRLVQARLEQVEEQVNSLSDTGTGSCCASYGYDPAKNKIMVRFRYGPDTLNRLTVQEAQQRLRQAAITAIAAAMNDMEQQPGAKLELNDFEVEFVTWDEHARFKTFAVYSNDHLELTNRQLK
jgi:hypothetical protein